MDSEKDFKDILNDKLNSVEFGFDEAAWHGANELLNQHHEKNKKRTLLPYLAALLLLIGTGAGIYFWIAEPAGEKISAKDNHAANSENATTNASLVSSDVRATNETKNASETTVSEKSAIDKVASVKTKSTNAPSNANKTLSQNANAVSNPVVNKTKKTNNQTTPEVKETPNAPELVKTPNQNPSITKTEPEKEAATTVNPQLPVINSNSTSTAEETKEENEVVAYQYLNSIPAFDKWILHSTDNEISFGPLALNDNVKFKNSIKKISIEGGVNYMLGWNNHGTRDANGFNPLIGINYSYIPARKIYYSLGIQYYSVGHLSYSNHISKVTRYSLGEESNVMVVTPNKLHYVGAPLKLNWKYNKNVVFGTGVTLAYLFNVTSTVETYNLKVNKKNDYTKSKTSGYTEGFKAYDAQLSLFAKYRLYKNLEANGEIYYGLIDQKNNTFFNSNVAERNWGLKLTLSYDILSN